METNPKNQETAPGTVFDRNGRIATKLESLAVQFWEVFIFSSAYLAVIAMAEVVVVMAILSLPLNLAPVIAALLTFAVYGTDRVKDLETDVVSTPDRVAYVERYRDHLYVLSTAAYGVAVSLSVFAGPLAFALSVLPGAVWLLYARDLIPMPDGGARRFKDFVVVNSLLVAVAWSAVIVFLPLVYVGGAVTPAAVLLFAVFVLATFVNTEIPNIRDIDADRATGSRTLPTVFGVSVTRQILFAVTGLAAGVVLVAYTGGVFGASVSLALLGVLACLAAVVGSVGRYLDPSALSFAAECTRVPLLLLLFTPLL